MPSSRICRWSCEIRRDREESHIWLIVTLNAVKGLSQGRDSSRPCGALRVTGVIFWIAAPFDRLVLELLWAEQLQPFIEYVEENHG